MFQASAIDSFKFKKMNNICLFVISVRIIVYVHVMTKTDGYVMTFSYLILLRNLSLIFIYLKMKK